MKRLDTTAAGTPASDIQGVLQSYEVALNGWDVSTVLGLFSSDGVFMAPNSPSATGPDAIRAAYEAIFRAITFDTELTVLEVTQVAPDWAVVRTTSSGFVTVHAIEQRVPDANHELFVFQKDGGGTWKIARYSFSSTNPPPQ